jgi:hypothetical protein
VNEQAVGAIGITPFWFWNGDMADDEIVRQIREMKTKGTSGFFLHPRQGLTIPYLSEEWFSKVGVAVETAKKEGLSVWLYDEYPYPSGIAGGEVILCHPEYEATTLRCIRQGTDGGEVHMDLPWGNIIAAYAYPADGGVTQWVRRVDLREYIGICRSEKIFQMTGLTAYNRKRFFEGGSFLQLDWRPGKGNWQIYVFVEVKLTHMKFYGRFVDPLIPGAVRTFIDCTHERYRARFSAEFGETIKGVFSDEIDLNPHGGNIRWSAALPALFEKKCGYSLTERLPTLLEPMGDDTDRVRYDYWNVMTDAFIANYDSQIQEWCHRNRLLYVAEKPVLRSRQLQYLDIPGCDAGHKKIYASLDTASADYRANPKIVSSGAHFYGKPHALCECFHSIGWGMTIQDMKWQIDWLVLHGVDILTPHAFYYTTNALAKHDAPPSCFFQQPYWADMGQLCDYVRRLCETVDGGSRAVNVVLVDPITSTWTAMGEKENLKKRLLQDFSHIQKTLLTHHIDYYVADPSLLAEFRPEGGRLCRGEESFRVLILPPMTNLEDEAAECVTEFIRAGVPVAAVSCLPAEHIGCRDAARTLAGLFGVDAAVACLRYGQGQTPPYTAQAGTAAFIPSPDGLPEYLETLGVRDFSVTSAGGEAGEILGMHIRRPDGDAWFFANGSGETVRATVRLGAPGGSQLCRLWPESGKTAPLSRREEAGKLALELIFAPFESVLLRASAAVPAMPSPEPAEMPLRGGTLWRQSIEGYNMLRLSRWELTVTAADGQALPGAPAAEVIPEPIVNQVEDGGIPLPLRTASYFGCPKELQFPALDCRYTARFDAAEDVRGGLLLAMEPGSIGGRWEIFLNGRLLRPRDFTRRAVWLPDNLAADISGLVRTGENVVELVVAAKETFDGLVNPLYICGHFGVCREGRLNQWKLTALPQRGLLEYTASAGLPFFAGTRLLTASFLVEKETDICLTLPDYRDCDAITAEVNGIPVGTCAWGPYRFPADASLLRLGSNTVTLRVRTTALGLYEGQRFDTYAHESVDLDAAP